MSRNKIYLDINIAHDRKGHMNENSSKTTMKQYAIESAGTLSLCPACLAYKSKTKIINKLSKN